MRWRDITKRIVAWCICPLTILGLGGCMDSNAPSSGDSTPLTSQRLLDFPYTTTTSAQSQIKAEARKLTVKDVMQYPYGSQIVNPNGTLKTSVALGTLSRLYSLMDNSYEAADLKLEGHLYRNNSLVNRSIRRDLSDLYMATVSAKGLGTIGAVYSSVYTVMPIPV